LKNDNGDIDGEREVEHNRIFILLVFIFILVFAWDVFAVVKLVIFIACMSAMRMF